VLGVACAIRLEAITEQYGLVARPAWLRALQETAQAPIRAVLPASMAWHREPMHPHQDSAPSPYYGDPHNYLRFAREMQSFYAAHWREPGYPFVVHVFLGLLGNQNVAASFASASCSVLMVLLTAWIGTVAFSRAVGLGAALALTIEYDAISCNILGGRDELFTVTALAFTYVVLRYVQEPTRRRAAIAGAWAGAACLVRITSLSFVLPGLACLIFVSRRPWKARLSDVAWGLLTMAVVAGPYSVNCWRVFGDPLRAINVPAGIYQETEGQIAAPSVRDYLGGKALERPIQLVDTVVMGMTSYPFGNKWKGLDRWAPWLGTLMACASLVGLFGFLGSTMGRVLLIILATALVPYSVTWKLGFEWRLTEVAYPFFLVAACAAISWVVMAPARVRAWRTWRPRRTAFAWWSAAVLGVLASVWIVTRTLPAWKVLEGLIADGEVTVAAGGRDGAFFGRGWSEAAVQGNATVRFSTGQTSTMWLPLTRAADYDLQLRMDPVSADGRLATNEPPVVNLRFNGTPLASLPLRPIEDRVGAYNVQIPRALAKAGFNRLDLTVGTDAGRYRLWYARVWARSQ
jgi:hypothetical protein